MPIPKGLKKCTVALYYLITCVPIMAQPPDCSRPKRTEPQNNNVAGDTDSPESNVLDDSHLVQSAPVMFSTPTPTGEITGARNSLGLPSIRLSLPKISFETPELTLHGFTRGRRDPQMQIDGAAAGVSSQNPLLFGHLPTPTTTHGTQTNNTNGNDDNRNNRGNDPQDQGCSDGCASNDEARLHELARQMIAIRNRMESKSHAGGQQSPSSGVSLGSSDPWRSSEQSRTAEYEREISSLHEQIAQLQDAVEKISATETVEKAEPLMSPNVRRRVDPWNTTVAQSKVSEQQQVSSEVGNARQIEKMGEDRLGQESSHSRKAASDKNAQSAPKASVPQKAVLARLANTLTRR